MKMVHCWLLLLQTVMLPLLSTQPQQTHAASGASYEQPDVDHAEFLATWRDVVHRLRHDVQLRDEWRRHQDKAVYLPHDDIVVPFNCAPQLPSNPRPTSVHKLRPSDINVVAALGDSITAANGVRAQSAIGIAFTNRGESWSIGGEKSLDFRVLTLPNILVHFNPALKGASVCRKTGDHEFSSMNIAVPGDTNRGMRSQAERLMLKMLQDADIDYYNDWKLITILIGGNDLCRHCQMPEFFSPDAYYEGVRAALDLFYMHLPRAIVHVVPMADVSIVTELNHPDTVALCELLHRVECPCAMSMNKDNMRATQLAYYNKMVELTSGRYDLRQDFTVVLQPFMRDLEPLKFPNGSVDMSFFAPDCFHPGHKAHQAMAFMLWDSMLTPVGSKRFHFNTTNYDAYKCPTEASPYIYTNCNSESNPPSFCQHQIDPPVDTAPALSAASVVTAAVAAAVLLFAGV